MDYIPAAGHELLDAHPSENTLSWASIRPRQVRFVPVIDWLSIAFRLLSFHIEVRRTIALREWVVNP